MKKIIILGCLLICCQLISIPVYAQIRSADSTEVENLNRKKLVKEVEKLQQEIINLKEKNRPSFFKGLSDFTGLFTVIIALAGVFITVWKFTKEQKNQKEKELKQAEKEFKLWAEESFNKSIENLGSDVESIQASAAVSLMSFLKEDYEFLHDQLFYIYLANLKTRHTETVNKLLVKGFEKAIRVYLENHKTENLKLDLSRANLDRIDLSGLNLNNADLGYASLELANLENTKLERIRGYKLNLKKAHLSQAKMKEARLQYANMSNAIIHNANLVSADLKNSVLINVQFHNTKLQSAHLEKSNIKGAKFERSYLADTFIRDVKYSKETLSSIKKAFDWEKVNFDKELGKIIKNQ